MPCSHPPSGAPLRPHPGAAHPLPERGESFFKRKPAGFPTGQPRRKRRARRGRWGFSRCHPGFCTSPVRCPPEAEFCMCL